MKKKLKTLIISGAGLIILAAAMLILLLTLDEPEESDIPESELTHVYFTELDPEYMQSINIKNEHGEYTITQSSSGVFAVSGLGNAPLNEISLNNAARYISGFWARDVVEENAENFEQYGLGDGAARVEAVFKNGQTLDVLIGDKTPTPEEMTYIRLVDDDTVYVIWSYIVNMFRESSFNLVALEITGDYYEIGAPSIESLIIERKGQERYVFLPNPAILTEEVIFNPFIFAEPVENIEVDATRGQSVMHGLFGMTASGVAFVGGELPPEIAEAFSEPIARVEMISEGKTSVFLAGDSHYTTNEDGESVFAGVYVTYTERPGIVYIFSPDALNWLSFDVESIMAPMFIRPYIYSVSQLILETPDVSLTFRLTGTDQTDEEYFLDGELIDTKAFKDLYTYLVSARAETLFKGEPEETEAMDFLARYTYKYRNNRPDAVIEFYDAGGMRSVIVVNGEPMFTTGIMYLTRLSRNIEAYLAGEPVINFW